MFEGQVDRQTKKPTDRPTDRRSTGDFTSVIRGRPSKARICVYYSSIHLNFEIITHLHTVSLVHFIWMYVCELLRKSVYLFCKIPSEKPTETWAMDSAVYIETPLLKIRTSVATSCERKMDTFYKFCFKNLSSLTFLLFLYSYNYLNHFEFH